MARCRGAHPLSEIPADEKLFWTRVVLKQVFDLPCARGFHPLEEGAEEAFDATVAFRLADEGR